MADGYDDYYSNISQMDRNLHQHNASSTVGRSSGRGYPTGATRWANQGGYNTIHRDTSYHGYNPAQDVDRAANCYAQPFTGSHLIGGHKTGASDSDYSSQDSTTSSGSQSYTGSDPVCRSSTDSDQCYGAGRGSVSAAKPNCCHDNQSYENGYVHLPSYQKYDPNA
ncbi:hypothetical protein LSH36_264g00044 [Paralvinella palmiformis]|uniref:Uncharacterized protein n=1 Tax=Paralvinella palmiformis TaxID=53620 RepID=A0AAD9JJY7_9ANNE|nr:hypothetical protein LSH36_264g00044 [Paralvinella palmiformis]